MAEQLTEVLMPLMGEGITEATLVRWLKKPGEAVRKEEPLLEVSTDKVDTEIPAPAAGVLLETLAADGDTVPINAVIAHIGAAGTKPAANGAAAKAKPPASASATGTVEPGAPARTTAPAAAHNPGTPKRSSPLVRKMARAMAIDLSQIQGTGLAGRITKRDLEAHATAPREAAAARRAPAAGAGAHRAWGKVETRRDGERELLDGVPVRREKMSKMRALIAEHMARSVRVSPHVTTVFEIDMHRVAKAREEHKSAFATRAGAGLTFTAFFAWAAVQAIKRYPIVNVSIDDEDILWKDQINLGIATAIETGLIVPVIKNAGELNLTGIARRIGDLATRARTKKLSPEDVQGGTFSITNPGMFGSLVSAPIINQPQVAILSIGAIVKRPVVIDDMIAIRPLCQVGLTFDHRVVDGEGGARYLAFFKDLLENFDVSAL
jgi:2-oxoglutarate dehydrogenase E2 component (dihydrolipoamide succinyltransferase)